MRSENYVAFFTVSGFFIGLSFSLVKSSNLTEFIFYLFAINFFFYIFIHLILIFFYGVEPTIKDSFDKVEFESMVNMQVEQIKERESMIEAIIASINKMKS